MSDSSLDWDFFIAHAGRDTETAERLYDYLVSRCRVFLDSRCLRLGDNWDAALADAQRRSLVTVVLVSRNTGAAYYQREEVAAAIAFARKDGDSHRVVPIYIDTQSDDATTPYGLRLKHGIAIDDDCTLADAASKLIELQRSLPRSGGSRSTAPSGQDVRKRPTRVRERIALLRWLNRTPGDFETYFKDLWRAGYGKDKISPAEVDSLETRVRVLIRDYTRIVEKLPGAFEQTDPSEQEKACFAEVLPALQRECDACFMASRQLIGGLSAPTSGDQSVPVPFSILYSALEVSEHLRILRMAAEELVILFPIDDVDEARREPSKPL
jgi:hypothetical protein